MKKQIAYFLFITIITVVTACVNTDEFLERPTYVPPPAPVAIKVQTNSAKKLFQVYVDEKLFKDNLSITNALNGSIPAGKHRVQIKELNKPDYFIDSTATIERTGFDLFLLETDPAINPVKFPGVPDSIAAPKANFKKINFINSAFNVKITIRILDYDNKKILAEFKDIPYNQLTTQYFEVSNRYSLENTAYPYKIVDATTNKELLDGYLGFNGRVRFKVRTNNIHVLYIKGITLQSNIFEEIYSIKK